MLSTRISRKKRKVFFYPQASRPGRVAQPDVDVKKRQRQQANQYQQVARSPQTVGACQPANRAQRGERQKPSQHDQLGGSQCVTETAFGQPLGQLVASFRVKVGIDQWGHRSQQRPGHLQQRWRRVAPAVVEIAAETARGRNPQQRQHTQRNAGQSGDQCDVGVIKHRC